METQTNGIMKTSKIINIENSSKENQFPKYYCWYLTQYSYAKSDDVQDVNIGAFSLTEKQYNETLKHDPVKGQWFDDIGAVNTHKSGQLGYYRNTVVCRNENENDAFRSEHVRHGGINALTLEYADDSIYATLE